MPPLRPNSLKAIFPWLMAALLLAVFMSVANAADITAPVTSEVTTTGTDTFSLEIRAKARIPKEFLRRWSFLQAAKATMASGATRFRMVKGTRKENFRRRGGRSRNARRQTVNVGIFLEIMTNKAGNPPGENEKWYPAKRVVEKLEANVNAEYEKFGAEAR